MIKLNCPTCKKEFEKYPSYVNRNNKRKCLIYCSRECSDKNRINVWKIYGKDTVNFKDGRTDYRKYALKEKGYICELCGYNGSEFPSLIWVHHKDFNKRSTNRNNDISNLQVLCVRCHLELHLAHEGRYLGGFKHAVSFRGTEKISMEVSPGSCPEMG